MKVFGAKARGTMVSPTALLVAEDERLYSVSLSGKGMDVEEILRQIPSLKEKIRWVPSPEPRP